MTLAPRVFADADALGRAVADETCAGVQEVARNGRPYLLGCPRGRGPLSTYMALARAVRAQDVEFSAPCDRPHGRVPH